MAVGVSLLASPLAASGDFSGPYAPESWMFTPGPFGSLSSHTASELMFMGGDSGFIGDTDVTVTVLADGVWSFHWDWVLYNGATEAFDMSYYLLNGIETQLAEDFSRNGDVTVTVRAGDVIGYRVTTLDGVFGPGTLTITDFIAPVPGPASVALPIICGAAPARRRGRPPRLR